MSGANVQQMTRTRPDTQASVDAELRHIQDLVFVRDLLASRGARADELVECDAVIDGLRERLAASMRRASARYAA